MVLWDLLIIIKRPVIFFPETSLKSIDANPTKRFKLVVLTMSLCAQLLGRETPLTIDLWEDFVPGVISGESRFIEYGNGKVRAVRVPDLSIHFPENADRNRMVLLVNPGGGYRHLSRHVSGNATVPKFLPRGAVVAVLKYRTRPPYTDDEVDDLALMDVKRAVRLLRYHADEWGIDPERVVVIGWSAGGNLTLNLATHADSGDANALDPAERMSSRPNAVGMMCPWPWKYSIHQYPVSRLSPPAFIAAAEDDETAPLTFAEDIRDAYLRVGVPVKLWTVPEGGHLAFSEFQEGYGQKWDVELYDWLMTIFPEKPVID